MFSKHNIYRMETQHQMLYVFQLLANMNKIVKKRECLNVGTVPTYKMHNIGTVSTFRMHNIGTVTLCKIHTIGTSKMHDHRLELEFGLFGILPCLPNFLKSCLTALPLLSW